MKNLVYRTTRSDFDDYIIHAIIYGIIYLDSIRTDFIYQFYML